MAERSASKTTTTQMKDLCCKEQYGLFIPAGLLIGMGLGFATGNLLAGLFGGLGAGVLVTATGKAFGQK